MKKLLFALVMLTTLSACKQDEQEYAYTSSGSGGSGNSTTIINNNNNNNNNNNGGNGSGGTQGPAGPQGPIGPQGPVGPSCNGDLSVNGLLITTINKSEAFKVSDGIKVTLIGGTSSVGNFYGGGTGNKAMVGVTAEDGLPLSQFNKIEITAKHNTPSMYSYANIVVDLDGDFSTPQDRIILTMAAGLYMQHTNTMSTQVVHDTDSAWYVSSYGTVNPSTVALNGHLSSGPPLPLTNLKAQFPNSKISKSGMIYDGGYSRLCPTASVNLNVGDSTYTQYQETVIKSIKINNNLYSF